MNSTLLIPILGSAIAAAFFGIRAPREKTTPEKTIVYFVEWFAFSFFVFLGLGTALLSPLMDLNGDRFVASLASWQGQPLRLTADLGPVLAWTYGPVGMLTHLPSVLFPSVNSMIQSAAVQSLLYYFLPALLLHLFFKKQVGSTLRDSLAGFACFGLLILSSPGVGSAVSVHVDAPAMAFTALACWFLFLEANSGNGKLLALSAFFASLAFLTKQSLIPIFIALPLYVHLSQGKRAALRYSFFLFSCLLVQSSIAIVIIGAEPLYFMMFKLLSHCDFLMSWTSPDSVTSAPSPQILFKVVGAALIDTIKQCAVLAVSVVCLICYQFFPANFRSKKSGAVSSWLRQRPEALMAWMGIWLLPTSVIPLAKVGGAGNSLTPALYFLTLSVTFALSRPGARGSWFSGGDHAWRWARFSFLVVFIFINVQGLYNFFHQGGSVGSSPVQLAYNHLVRHPGKTYFPEFPLASLLSEKKLYHSQAGLTERRCCHQEVSRDHLFAHFPSGDREIAFRGMPREWFTDQMVNGYDEGTDPELPGWKVFRKRKGSM